MQSGALGNAHGWIFPIKPLVFRLVLLIKPDQECVNKQVKCSYPSSGKKICLFVSPSLPNRRPGMFSMVKAKLWYTHASHCGNLEPTETVSRVSPQRNPDLGRTLGRTGEQLRPHRLGNAWSTVANWHQRCKTCQQGWIRAAQCVEVQSWQCLKTRRYRAYEVLSFCLLIASGKSCCY